MAWDTEATKRRLLTAATEEFAATGFAGARVNAIATAAGVNKERIYSYFGDKAGLFGAVLASEVEELLRGISVTGTGPDATGALGGDLFDRAAAHPHLPRLLAWESLELEAPVSASERAEGCAALVTSLASALPGAPRSAVAQLLFSLVSLATAHACLPRLAELIDPDMRTESRRKAVIAQARALGAMS